MDDETELFEKAGQGNPRTSGELLPRVYAELRELAIGQMAREAPGNTLQATALVHEAYLRLLAQGEDHLWDNTGHFFSAAAEAMRRILIERARGKQCKKRGGEHQRQDLEPLQVELPEPAEDLLALDEALGRLEQQHPRLAELVRLRYFAGLTVKAAAEALGIAPRTADADWAYARAWLLAELSEESGR